LRVKLDAVAGETVFGNQDGDREQENISTFQAGEAGGGEPLKTAIRLHNDDLANPQFFYLSYEDDIPAGWQLDINGGDLSIELAAGEVREIPVVVEPSGGAALGSVFAVDIQAARFKDLVNDLDPSDQHLEFNILGGVRVETRVVRQPELLCEVEKRPDGIFFRCDFKVDEFDRFYSPDNPFQVLLTGLDRNRRFLKDLTSLVRVDANGHFEGLISGNNLDTLSEVTCLFAGTAELGSATCGLHLTGPRLVFLPVAIRK
jgi:hypothetical protein